MLYDLPAPAVRDKWTVTVMHVKPLVMPDMHDYFLTELLTSLSHIAV